MDKLAEFFTSGSQFDTAKLVRLRTLAELLPVAKQRKIFNDLSGDHHSHLRGRGMDFSEVRRYQSGDDIRSMDWRVTARTGKAHVKVFHEERERPVMLACDLRAGMYFGSKRCLKAVLAADLCTLMGWASSVNGDRIGALLFTDTHELDLRPQNGHKAVLRLIHELQSFTPSAANQEHLRFTQVLRHLSRVVRPGSRVYIISDWAGFSPQSSEELYTISRHSDVVALHVSDPLEQQLPPPGHYPITDGQQQGLLANLTTTQRQQFAALYVQQFEQLQQQLHKLGIPLLPISTADANPLIGLQQGLGITFGAKV